MGFGSVVLKQFVKLEDTPVSYTGKGSNLVTVKSDESGLEFVSTSALPAACFTNTWSAAHSDHPTFDVATFSYDGLLIGVHYLNDDLRIYSSRSVGWNYLNPHTMRFWAQRGPNAGGRPTLYMAMVDSQLDLHDNRSARHIAFIERDNQVYFSCGNGAAYTEVAGDAAVFAARRWLKWVRTATGVEFYIDGVLKTTITTNVPAAEENCRMLYQMISTYTGSRVFWVGQPRYTHD